MLELAVAICACAALSAFFGAWLASPTDAIETARKAIRHDQVVLTRFLRDEIRKQKRVITKPE